jgi:hypothetical protein
MIWALLLIPALLGLILLIVGWRGRRIDNHPLCRRCGYDLVASETAINCPECGADLWQPHAMRIGHRRKRKVALALGGLMLLATLGGGGVFGWAVAKNFDFNPYKPLWMLKREATAAGAANAQRAVAAQTEILARLNTGKLAPSQIDSIVNEALASQPDPNAAWHVWWGDFIENAWKSGRVSDDVAVQYIKQAVAGAVSLDLPRRTREGAMMWVYVTHRPMRAGRTGTFMVEMQRGPVLLEDGTQLGGGGGMSRWTVSIGGSGRGGSGMQVNLKPGTHTATMEARLRAGPANKWLTSTPLTFSSDPRELADDDANDDVAKMLATWTLPLQATIEVVPRDQDLVELVSDPSLAEEIKRHIIIERCALMLAGSNRALLACRLRLNGSPIDAAFEVLVRAGEEGREWHVDDILFKTGDQPTPPLTGSGLASPMPWVRDFPPDAERVDIVLRTSKRLAEDSGLERVWDGEIVIENVPLERIDPSGRRRTPPM